MPSVSSAPDKANGIVGKPASKEPKPAAGPDVVGVEEGEEGAGEDGEEDEDDQYEDGDDEEETQMVGDDEDQDEEEEGEEQDVQDKPQSLTHFLLDDPEGQPDDNDEDEFDEEESEDVYIPPAPEPISRKRSHQEVAEDDEEPDSKKAKA